MRIEKALKEFMNYCIYDRQMTFLTIKNYRYELNRFVEFVKRDEDGICYMENFDQDKAQAYIDESRARNISEVTLLGQSIVILRFLNYYYKLGVLKYDPRLYIKKIKKPSTNKTPLNIKELRRLLNVKMNYKVEPHLQFCRDKTILGLFIFCGLRAGEISKLLLDDVNLPEKYIRINNAKYQIDRLIPIEEPLISWIKNYLSARSSKDSRYLIVGKSGKAGINKCSLTHIVMKLGIAASIKKGVYSHILRHSFASLLFKNKVDLHQLKTIMGHSRIEETARYVLPDNEAIKDALLSNPLIKYYPGGRGKCEASKME